MELGLCLCEDLVELRRVRGSGNCVGVPQGCVHGEIKDRVQRIGALPFGNWAEPCVSCILPLETVGRHLLDFGSTENLAHAKDACLLAEGGPEALLNMPGRDISIQ